MICFTDISPSIWDPWWSAWWKMSPLLMALERKELTILAHICILLYWSGYCWWLPQKYFWFDIFKEKKWWFAPQIFFLPSGIRPVCIWVTSDGRLDGKCLHIVTGACTLFLGVFYKWYRKNTFYFYVCIFVWSWSTEASSLRRQYL